MLFCHVTSRVAGRDDDDLLAETGSHGYPTLSFLDQSGEVLAVHDGPRTVAGLRATLAGLAGRLAELKVLRDRAARGDDDSRARLTAMELRGRSLSLAVGRRAAAELGELAPEVRAELDAGLAYVEYMEVLDQTRGMVDQAVVAGGKFLAMARAGRIPPPQRARFFWEYALHSAASRHDQEAFDSIFDRYAAQLQEMYGKGDRGARALLDRARTLRERMQQRRVQSPHRRDSAPQPRQ